jgi:hypothetical protein
MKKITIFRKILFYYSLVFTSLLIVSGIFMGISKNHWGIFLLLFFVFLYFPAKKIKGFKSFKFFLSFFSLLTLILVSIVTIATAKSLYQIVLGLTFAPVALYFWLEIVNRWLGSYLKKSIRAQKAIVLARNQPVQVINQINNINNVTQISQPRNFQISDENRRQFLKLIGGTSVGFIIMSLMNPKQAGATFFGSVPGPGTVSLKDSSGDKIDPAEKQATDGYKISQVDDASSPAYYGYLNSDGLWYIMEEDSSGTYLYARGTTAFLTNWGNRDGLSYDYFDTVF